VVQKEQFSREKQAQQFEQLFFETLKHWNIEYNIHHSAHL
jgi:hypothetical protein